jgi:hypothetical protein
MNQKLKGISVNLPEKNSKVGSTLLVNQESKKELVTIKGTLTSRIETKNKNGETYSYGFFQIEGQSQEIPVIFKGGGKHGILIGSQVELTGN